MSRYDVVVIGAGPAGLSAGALLAKEGRSVCVVEASPWLGGRGVAVPDEGFKINVGGHLVEDSGSGITKVFEHVGKELIHGPASSDMVIWEDGWKSVRDLYSADKTELKRVIDILLETPYEDLDDWDDRTLREWMLQHTRHEGVIALWEFITVLEAITENWWDHSASDNLYTRKMHYSEKRVAGYSFWPGQGWGGMFNDLRDALVEHGGEIRLNTRASRVVIEDGKLQGLAVAQPHVLPNEIFEEEMLEADAVISTLPVWSVLRVVPEQDLPDWYVAQIKHLSRIEFRATWLGVYLATKEPIHALDPRELATWLHTPNLPHAGFFFNQTAMDPTTSPDGTYLYVGGLDIPGEKVRDVKWMLRTQEQFERDLAIMYPGLEHAFWRRRHLVHEPGLGVIQKPNLVGRFRPHWRAPNVEGLYFASDTFRSRGVGVDRAARAGLTVVEDYLGRRLSTFGDGWRY
ncbi:MAG: NAD(P)/FAD-dependent oxidoreductase [Solirubrobacterales bacterium]|nr:NAD(P)/FAD-dependent oxidoreductase [Solirubrobacterales bacterium]